MRTSYTCLHLLVRTGLDKNKLGLNVKRGSKLVSFGTRNILVLGLISCFADISSEMVYPIIPLYLTAAFGATPVLVGVIEGIAESLASLLKVVSGYVSDKFQHRKALAFAGYSTGVFYKFALLFAHSWAGILLARIIDRFGKGVRTAPRDAMISASAGSDTQGGAFGLHKMLDMLGSAAGILISFFIVAKVGESGFKTVFAVSLIPIVLALLLFSFVHDAPRTNDDPAVAEDHPKSSVRAQWARLDSRLKLYLLVTVLFTLGNSSNTFLLLRASDVGFSDSSSILLYFTYNITASLLALPCGRLSDHVGRRALLVCGYLTFSLVYLGFGLCSSKPLMVAIFILYGAYTALTTGAERALIAEIAPPELKGTMFGLQSTLVGVALLPASVIAGILWSAFGAPAPFIFGAVLSLAAALILLFGLKPSSSSASRA